MPLKAAFQEISSPELSAFLLKEIDQDPDKSINIPALLEFLNLTYCSVDLVKELEFLSKEDPLRALFSFNDKLIITDESLANNSRRKSFSILHEVAHYVLPAHVDQLFLCTEHDISFASSQTIEREANSFAADLLFQGVNFTLKVNSMLISPTTIKNLADNYGASYESTARRLVEKNIRPCFLAVLERKVSQSSSREAGEDVWKIRYCIASKSFSNQYFHRIIEWPENDINADKIIKVSSDIAESLTVEENVEMPKGKSIKFRLEYFTNTYNIFCLFIPITSK